MKKIKILGYICARLGSSRLPGKMLMDIAGKPAIQCVYDRLSQSKYLDKVVVATSNKPIDDPLCDYMQKNSIEFNKCLLLIDKNISKKKILKIKKSLKNKKIYTHLITANEANKNQKIS